MHPWWIEEKDLDEIQSKVEEAQRILSVAGHALERHKESFWRAVRTGRNVEPPDNPVHKVSLSSKNVEKLREVGEALINLPLVKDTGEAEA